MFDVIVIGGSYAGMAAAMQLARARRRVLVVDAGQRRNRFAVTAHGFLGRDGVAPGAIADEARAQVLAYPTVSWIEGSAVAAGGAMDAFTVTLADGTRHRARRLVLATGVVDILPDVPGLAAQWGKGAMACPYCHGYEMDGGEIGVLATGPLSFHHAAMLPEWGRTTFFTNDAVTPDEAQAQDLARRGVTVEPAPVRRIGGEPGRPVVHLADGRDVAIAGLFVMTRIRQASDIASRLGCDLDETPIGPLVKADAMTRETSVPGVFACGDLARAAASISFAVADGAAAGSAGAHRSLIFGVPASDKAA